MSMYKQESVYAEAVRGVETDTYMTVLFGPVEGNRYVYVIRTERVCFQTMGCYCR